MFDRKLGAHISNQYHILRYHQSRGTFPTIDTVNIDVFAIAFYGDFGNWEFNKGGIIALSPLPPYCCNFM